MSSQDPKGRSDEDRGQPDEGKVSEVGSLESVEEGVPEAPADATAGYPESESGHPDEGTAGPDAPPRHGRPEDSDESSR